MKLNHLTAPAVLAAQACLEKYFSLLNPRGGKVSEAITVLYDDAGLVFTLVKARSGTDVTYPASFHVGFIQESQARVNEIYQRLRAGGFDVDLPTKQHGSWTFYFLAPGGFTIEVPG